MERPNRLEILQGMDERSKIQSNNIQEAISLSAASDVTSLIEQSTINKVQSVPAPPIIVAHKPPPVISLSSPTSSQTSSDNYLTFKIFNFVFRLNHFPLSTFHLV